MSILILKAGFLLLGGAAVLIGASNYFLGIAVTADTLALMLAPVGLESGGFQDLASPNVDNEFRFYAVLWIAYGIVLLRTATRLPADLHWVPPLTGIFLAGGFGRLLSIARHGPPDPLFMLLTYLEFALCAIFLVAWFLARRSRPARL
jgi:hypothetical protein